jgi:hypothetical protein
MGTQSRSRKCSRQVTLQLEALETRTLPSGQTAQLISDGIKIGSDIAVAAIDTAALVSEAEIKIALTVVSNARTAGALASDLIDGNFTQAAIDAGGLGAKALGAPILAVVSDLSTLFQDVSEMQLDLRSMSQPSPPTTQPPGPF